MVPHQPLLTPAKVLSVLAILCAPVCGQWPPPAGFTVEDLVRASRGGLAVYAQNLTTGKQLSLNGDVRRPVGSARRLLVAATALAVARERHHGTGYVLGRPGSAQGDSVLALVEATVRRGDLDAEERLVAYVSPGRLSSWVRDAEIAGLGPFTPPLEALRQVLSRRDTRFSGVPAANLSRWFRHRDATAIVPRWFPTDPRRASDHAARMTQAYSSWHAAGLNHASPRSLVTLLSRVEQSRAGHPDDCATLRRVLGGVTTLTLARDIGVRLIAGGLDGASRQHTCSLGLVRTNKGVVILSLHASGYPLDTLSQDLLAGLGRDVVRRLAPGCEPGAGAAPVPPRVLRLVSLVDAAEARKLRESRNSDATSVHRSVFRIGQRPSLAMRLAPSRETVVTVAWVDPAGRRIVRRHAFPARKITTIVDDITLTRTGRHRVEAAIDGTLVADVEYGVLNRE